MSVIVNDPYEAGLLKCFLCVLNNKFLMFKVIDISSIQEDADDKFLLNLCCKNENVYTFIKAK